MPKYYLPSVGGQIEQDEDSIYQSSPLLNTYSPRLFGAPPQLTSLNDMRLLSSVDDKMGPVGDFYLNDILLNASVANFVVGRAIFTGGMSTAANVIRVAGQYAYALSKYDLYDNGGNPASGKSVAEDVMREANMDTYRNALEAETGDFKTTLAETVGLTDVDDGTVVADLSGIGEASSLIDSISQITSIGSGALASSILTSLSVQQPFYTFESNWSTHINNVKMMINTAVIMMGLQSAPVLIGDTLYPIGMNVNITPDNDVWSNYRYITPSTGLGDVTGIDAQNGDTSQYVSFMIDDISVSESYSNTASESQLFSSVINQGSAVGSEIAFIANSSVGSTNDDVIRIASESKTAAEDLLSSLSSGAGTFTASIASSMARSFVGDHTIYPKIFTGHSSTESYQITVHLNASGGDPYSQLTEIMVPCFHALALVLPQLSKNNASAYTYPPIVQLNIPGFVGVRLGMVTDLTIQKNTSNKNVSVNGYPNSVTLSMTVTDLQHTLVSSGMNKVSTFLNNSTMFDYIAQCAGVDKYRVNGSIRLVARLALASAAVSNTFVNIGDALLNDFTSFANRISGVYRN